MNKTLLGQLNFEAYAEDKGGITYDGKPIPPWKDLQSDVQSGWEAGAERVKKELEAEVANADLAVLRARRIRSVVEELSGLGQDVAVKIALDILQKEDAKLEVTIAR